MLGNGHLIVGPRSLTQSMCYCVPCCTWAHVSVPPMSARSESVRLCLVRFQASWVAFHYSVAFVFLLSTAAIVKLRRVPPLLRLDLDLDLTRLWAWSRLARDGHART